MAHDAARVSSLNLLNDIAGICEDSCHENGYCSSVNECICNPGFVGKDCSICLDPNICNNTLDMCDQIMEEENKTFSVSLNTTKEAKCGFDIHVPTADSITLRIDVFNVTLGTTFP
jgi:hypothetical protein